MARHGGGFSEAKKASIFTRDNGICQICQIPIGDAVWNLDHIIPHSQGGSKRIDNLRLTHYDCNVDRGNDLSHEDNQLILGKVYDQQNGKCAGCKESMSYGGANKVAKDARFPISLDNFMLMHRQCRVLYNTTIVASTHKRLRQTKSSCIKNILGCATV